MALWSLDSHCFATFYASTSSIQPRAALTSTCSHMQTPSPIHPPLLPPAAGQKVRPARSVAAERLQWWRGFIGGQCAGDHLDPSLHRPQIPTPCSPQLLSYYHNFSWLHVLQNVLCFIAWESEAGAAASADVIRKAVMWKMKGATCPAERGVRVK